MRKPELTAAEANRLVYASYAERYDDVEPCAANAANRAILRTQLDRALEHCQEPRLVLDAGGGTGNAAAILAERGINPTVVDVSTEMLARWRSKASRLGLEPKTVQMPLESFFDADSERWDLIVFSSVLHHLEYPAEVLAAAAGRLARGGVLVTSFDPTLAGRVDRTLRRFDWVSHALLHHPRAVWHSIRSRVYGRGDPHAQIGRIAERHAATGLDHRELVGALQRSGLEIVACDLFFQTRWRSVAPILRWLRRPSMFAITARRAA